MLFGAKWISNTLHELLQACILIWLTYRIFVILWFKWADVFVLVLVWNLFWRADGVISAARNRWRSGSRVFLAPFHFWNWLDVGYFIISSGWDLCGLVIVFSAMSITTDGRHVFLLIHGCVVLNFGWQISCIWEDYLTLGLGTVLVVTRGVLIRRLTVAGDVIYLNLLFISAGASFDSLILIPL